MGDETPEQRTDRGPEELPPEAAAAREAINGVGSATETAAAFDGPLFVTVTV